MGDRGVMQAFIAVECKANPVPGGWTVFCRYQTNGLMVWENGTANYLVIAVRQGEPSFTQPTTWSQTEAEFAE